MRGDNSGAGFVPILVLVRTEKLKIEVAEEAAQ